MTMRKYAIFPLVVVHSCVCAQNLASGQDTKTSSASSSASKPMPADKAAKADSTASDKSAKHKDADKVGKDPFPA